MDKERGPRNNERVVYYRLTATEYRDPAKIAAEDQRTVSALTRLASTSFIEARKLQPAR